ncbi:hypothetical protein EV659_105204 [Rhodothalassium salexigens DSM 2132]|uniref:Uncharacterized protein n=1 Tax=Rhodothalassium salexigens DSM 2132 TaxID=1188247 RepID=A0A4R2PGS1_RHOSA|nr:hypothetical protein [Rhodothalassium salexigens]MBB4211496.1 hypothetical protein [Rhodothalassium salexigens DSM 2132]MBK1640018.1 hypothetical protein [Rhodothalassium salexigens DSM 2132]TCP34572.1 hypothetical protein EV659_105204 [Rhodothalassium salexigens DSM 2132]
MPNRRAISRPKSLIPELLQAVLLGALTLFTLGEVDAGRLLADDDVVSEAHLLFSTGDLPTEDGAAPMAPSAGPIVPFGVPGAALPCRAATEAQPTRTGTRPAVRAPPHAA